MRHNLSVIFAPVTFLRKAILPSWVGRNFQLLTISAVISTLGSAGAVSAASFAVLRAGGSDTDVGLIAAARTVPLVLFLLVGGAVADRFPRQKIMVAANGLSALSQALFAALVLSGGARMWQMAILSALGGVGQAFFAPASQGLLLANVETAHASRAFAVYRLGVNSANIGGVALGGILTAVFGPGIALAVDAGSFVLAALLRSFLNIAPSVREKPVSGMWRDLREGWLDFAGRRWLWAIVLQFSVVNTMVVAVEAVYGPQVAESRLGGAAAWGIVLAAQGAGNFLGGMLMVRWQPDRFLYAATLAVFPYALPAAALAVAVPTPGLVVVMMAAGCSVQIFGVGWMQALHQEIPEDRISRVSAYDALGSYALLPIGTAVAGPVASAIGISGALWGAVGLTVLLTAAVLFIPEVRRMRREQLGDAAAESDASEVPGDALSTSSENE
ncbi:MFS transporter [Streptomyces noursei]|uniref:MFS transporter n=1 Tax=Streptomyces noursei TaxID=1971 RepID=A0A401QRW6_STRNR|nr:MFS transporter [Streptomyces noursei]